MTYVLYIFIHDKYVQLFWMIKSRVTNIFVRIGERRNTNKI